MAYTNSPLVAHTNLSPNHSGQRTQAIDRITPHCVVGQCTAEGLGDWFAKTSTQASSNYGIDKDGRIGLYVEERNRSWCTSSSANDQRAVTIECASDTSEPYAFRDVVYKTLIKLCTDICRRNGKTKLLWLGDKDKTLNYRPAANEMVLTVHRWYANKSCPGNWMFARMGNLVTKVTAALCGKTSTDTPAPAKAELYRVRKSWANAKSQLGAYKILATAKKKADDNPGYTVYDSGGNAVYPVSEETVPDAFVPYLVEVSITNLNIRTGPGTDNAATGHFTGKGVFTIVDEADGQGASRWGRLKSGTGWISLDYAKKL
ncbi:MAG: N-acetylmuramoyl-L-alanine amidase [Lachnospiraceae bacterium]|nr:N-acetylmuramoyl-L-alanine amidase [Lachnospiraceae bacterium]